MDDYRPGKSVKEADQKPMQYPIERLVRFCRQVINEYSLTQFLKEPRTLVFENLPSEEKEKLCAGIIKLGEALTYCRDSKEERVQITGICDFAVNYIKLRNHFVHHHVYQDNLRQYDEINKKLHLLGSIDSLNRSLELLEKCQITMLSKERKPPGTNPFKFEYSHFVKCLKDESILLSKALAGLQGTEEIPFGKKVFLENRIRNILTTLMDLLDEGRNNTNWGDAALCEVNKKAVLELNKNFSVRDIKYEVFFQKLRGRRNALCHLESEEDKPYVEGDNTSLLGFAHSLDELICKNYVEAVEKAIVVKKAEAPRVGILERVETQRKPREKVKIPLVVVGPKKIAEPKKSGISGLASLQKAYNKTAQNEEPSRSDVKDIEQDVHEPEKKKERKESPTRSPRSGGM